MLKLYKFVKNSFLKEILNHYRPFLMFLSKFLLSYLVLILIYQWYLNQFDAQKTEVDGVTAMVADQVRSFMSFISYDVSLSPYPNEASVLVSVGSNPIVRIIEGCNAISVMILFVAFIIAFSRTFAKTLGFIVLGIVLIHILNVLRIAFLIIGILNFPEYEHLLHGVVFPLIIYGFVFFLWVIWVNKFQADVKKTN